MSVTNFINQTWTATDQTVNDVTDAGTKITVYTSPDYDAYVTFLSGTDASGAVTGSAELAQSTLDSFKTEVDTHGDYAIHVETTVTALADGKAGTFCISQADYGMTCALAKNVDSDAANETYATYWFAKADYAAEVTLIKASATTAYDLATKTTALVAADSYLFGIDQYVIEMNADWTMITADKF